MRKSLSMMILYNYIKCRDDLQTKGSGESIMINPNTTL